MDTWTIIALAITVPAAAFLFAAAGVSALRMSRHELRSLLYSGLFLFLLVPICTWLDVYAWLNSPWDSIIQFIGNIAGFVIVWAFIAAITVSIRYGMGCRKNRCS